MNKQKVKMFSGIVFGALLGVLLLSLSYVLFPDTTSQQPTPVPTSKAEPWAGQILWTIQWIGLAALITIIIVCIFLLVKRVIIKKNETVA